VSPKAGLDGCGKFRLRQDSMAVCRHTYNGVPHDLFGYQVLPRSGIRTKGVMDRLQHAWK